MDFSGLAWSSHDIALKTAKRREMQTIKPRSGDSRDVRKLLENIESIDNFWHCQLSIVLKIKTSFLIRLPDHRLARAILFSRCDDALYRRPFTGKTVQAV